MVKCQIWPTENSNLSGLFGTLRPPRWKLPVTGKAIPVSHMDSENFSEWDLKTAIDVPIEIERYILEWQDQQTAWSLPRLITVVLVICFHCSIFSSKITLKSVYQLVVAGLVWNWGDCDWRERPSRDFCCISDALLKLDCDCTGFIILFSVFLLSEII
jgi:hypothetical protein